jgi:predicted transporter
MYFPNDALLATALLYLAFLGLAGGAGLLMILGKGDETEPLERTLGLVMILIAAYFVISALVMPQFSQVSRIYRLATYSQESDVKFGLPQYLTLGILAVLLVTGFFLGRREVKNNLSRGV